MTLYRKFISSLFGRFLFTGLIIRAIDFALNFLLAEVFELAIRPVYFLVMVVDFSLGYLNSRYVVFKTKNKSHKDTLTKFLIAGIGFRLLDWLIYVYIVERFNLYISIAQLVSMVFIVIIKFIVLKRIFK